MKRQKFKRQEIERNVKKAGLPDLELYASNTMNIKA